MAANSSSRVIASLGKRVVVSRIRVRLAESTHLSPLALRRAAHSSVYDKNPDEQIRPSFSPDNVIPSQPEKYWGPNPRSGVFGPEAAHNSTQAGEAGAVNGNETSVLEEKAWYRPTNIEDVEKPHLT
ncbi:late embryogenesis abundant protein At5g17165-like [Argentina anserina]|uniref:late embryogenesis abundant protein At5g17165-like n=1 Tax=Argentina anserina TaxID=57926 RepID=UPI002176855B|nr:late embryogenesis abundant protein At5g17165-like [Potentilla anserina]